MDRGSRLFVGSIAALLFAQTVGTGLAPTATAPLAQNPRAIADAIRAIEAIRKSIANYRVAPYLGENPCRDPIYRGGFWNDRALASRNKAALKWLGDKAHEKLFALGANPLAILDGGVSGGGSGLPGEGRAPGGGTGGIVNTNTGNRMLPVHLVGWQMKGGMSVNFTLFHNSQTDFNQEFGSNWSHSFGAVLERDTEADPDIATLRWGDGLEAAKLKLADVRACFACGKKDYVNSWLQLADAVLGYPGLTGSETPFPHVNPIHRFEKPVREDPDGGSYREKKLKREDKSRKKG